MPRRGARKEASKEQLAEWQLAWDRRREEMRAEENDRAIRRKMREETLGAIPPLTDSQRVYLIRMGLKEMIRDGEHFILHYGKSEGRLSVQALKTWVVTQLALVRG